MRKALLVVVLVAASFGGGAVVNGPGLTWAKGMIGGRLHDGDAIPTLDAADEGASPSIARTKSDPPPSKSQAFPSAPAPALGENIPQVATATPPAESKPTLVAEPPAEARKSLTGLLPTEAPSMETIPELPPSTTVTTLPPKAEPAREDPAIMAASLAPSAAASSSDWAAIRVRMKGLGITRYWIEGTPGGPSTFRCAIPLAGSSSVFQQFEAEGDDELRAAEAALRRITLWKATEKD